MTEPRTLKITIELDVERDDETIVHTIRIPAFLNETGDMVTIHSSVEFLGDVISTLNANGVRARVE
jgi:hypothetical protein